VILPGDPAPDRVLILTPTGQDAEMIRARLLGADLPCEVCSDMDALLAGIASGAGAVMVAQEALSLYDAEALLAALEAQEPWSDIPMLILIEATSKKQPRIHPVVARFERTNVTLLERPLPIQLFLSAVRSAVRARRRQYEMRNLYRDLERAVQLSDLFVSILGHDLRTPLGAIRLSAETIVRLSAESRALRPAGRILRSADRMTRMIEQLLDYARVRQGHGIPLQPGPANLGEICRPVFQEIEDAHPQARLLVQEMGDLSGVWDSDRLAQVVSNLVSNAVQHGIPGGDVAVELDGRDATAVRLRVHNAGSIPADAVATLFEAFKQAPAQQAPGTRKPGLGLGLFIAREIARAHGGDLGVRSSEVDGTTFEVTLPRQAQQGDVWPLLAT
jgi:two-component system sensor histidine kinase/response regulator